MCSSDLKVGSWPVTGSAAVEGNPDEGTAGAQLGGETSKEGPETAMDGPGV